VKKNKNIFHFSLDKSHFLSYNIGVNKNYFKGEFDMIGTETKVSTEATVAPSVKVFERDFAPHRRVSIRICKTCGNTYILNDSDAKYFIENFGSLPLRCENCREKRRKENPFPKTETTDEVVVAE